MTENELYNTLRKKDNPTDIERFFIEYFRKLGNITEILVQESKTLYKPEVALLKIRELL